MSEAFLEATGLSPELMIILLMCKRPEWAVARDMLKYVDLCQEPAENTLKIVKHYVERHSQRFPEKFRNYLTSHFSELE